MPPKRNMGKPKNAKLTIKRLLSYLSKYKFRLVFVFICVIVSAVAGILGTYMLKPIVNNGIQPISEEALIIGENNLSNEEIDILINEALSINKEYIKYEDYLKLDDSIKENYYTIKDSNALYQKTCELGASLLDTNSYNQITIDIIILAVVYILGAVSTYLYSRIMVNVTSGTLNDLRRDLFNHLQDLPVSYFDKTTHGELMSRFTNDVDIIRQCISQGLTSFLSSIIKIVGTFVLMVVLSPILTVMIILMVFIMLVIVKNIGGKSAKYFMVQQKEVGHTNGYIEEMIEGMKVVKVFNHEEAINNEFDLINESLRDASTNANVYASILMPIMGNISYLNYALTACIGGLLVVNGMMDIGSLSAFLQSSRTFSQPINQISQEMNNILAALAGAERIFEVLDEEKEIDEGYVTICNAKYDELNNLVETTEKTNIYAWKHPHKDGTITYTQVRGDVRFFDLTFSYVPNKVVLDHLSLYAKPSQKIAFVGSTGAGKTTITNLINRFYNVEEGKIRYDGININKIKLADLRKSMAMVLQDTHLFNGTVRENIRYGKLDATDEEVINAAKLANAHHFISLLPNGYDTMLVSDGRNLSQGQRQLLAIARAAISNPPVLILDEATSSIDTRTERLIEKGMDKLMEGRTVFVIAHRLSTVRNSNAIMVLEHGKIIERGDHDDLINQKGHYYQLYTGAFELD